MERKRVRITALLVAFATIMTLVMGRTFITSAETVTYATVTASSAKVRSNTDTTSEVVGSLKSGDQVQILSEVTDANGQVWYKVNVVGGTGYVRGDLVTKGEPQQVDASTNTQPTQVEEPSQNQTQTTDTTTADNTQTAETLPDTQVTAMDSTTATVTTKKANVRSGAGTAYSVAGSVAAGDVVTITGSANDSAGKQWYYITLSNGVQGFIRADLVQIGAPETTTNTENTESTGENTENQGDAQNTENQENPENTETTEGENTEQTENTQEANNNGNGIVATTSSDAYFVFIDQDGTYQLVKNTDGNAVKYSVEGVLAANDYVQKYGAKKGLGVLNIILIVLVVILAGAVIFLFVRLRNLLYYDDEGGNYEDDNMQYDEEPRPRKPGLFARLKAGKKDDGYDDGYGDGYGDGYDEGYPDDGYPEEYPEEGPAPEDMPPVDNGSTVRPDRNSRPTPRKSRNFADDDDFEFEFLDLDNENDGKRR